MTRQHFRKPWAPLAIATSLVISGCGGGSSSSGTTTTENDTVSGTAAAGAPLSGYVGAKGSQGGTATTNVNSDGSFELDLSDLNTPVLLYANGIAGGQAYELLSVAFDSDLGGTSNITPLTNLVVANAAGNSPQDTFNNFESLPALTEEDVEAQETALKARLKPLLDGLGVEENFDLRNSTFAADRSGFDAALDVIEVQVNSDNTATIRNRTNPTQTITNSFTQPDAETSELAVDETELNNATTALQALNNLASQMASALESQDEQALTAVLSDGFQHNGFAQEGWVSYLLSTEATREDATELAEDFRNWSLSSIAEDGNTAALNVGEAQGPWLAEKTDDGWTLAGNGLSFFVFVESTHALTANGAENPEVAGIGAVFYAMNPAPTLSGLTGSTVTVSGDVDALNGPLSASGTDYFSNSASLAADALSDGDKVIFTWSSSDQSIEEEATFTIRRGQPDLNNGAPEITASAANLSANEYSFEWILPAGYDAISVRNNFTGQQSEQGGFTGDPLANEATSYTGELPEGYVPATSDELRLIARDPFGVFVSVGVTNPFPDQIPEATPEENLVGSWVVRNTSREDNAPFIQLTFLESGHYIHLELGTPYRTDSDDGGSAGMEFGTYEWNSDTGEITIPNIILDENGSWGLTDVANNDEDLAFDVSGDTLTVYPLGGSTNNGTVFTRVAANESGITGSWAIQDPTNPDTLTVVLTLFDDGFYFVGAQEPADDSGQPGLEFGTYEYDVQTTELTATALIDQNGEFGLADPLQGFDYTTVIDGYLIFDDGEATQLTEILPGNTIGSPDLTVDYTSPTAN